MKVSLKLPDGSKIKVDKNATGLDVVKQIGDRLAQRTVACRINEELKDLSTKITKDASFEAVTTDSDEGFRILNHSASHVMAKAVLNLFPNAKPTIGPSIEKGYYYDFYVDDPFDADDIKLIEEEMQKVIDQDLSFKKVSMSREEALKYYKNNKFKKELIKELKGKRITLYELNGFKDLCKGPHIPSTKYLKAFKIINQSSAYWRGDAKKESLQRLYGIAFMDKKELSEFLRFKEEAENRNHIKLGKELDLFVIDEVVGKGLPLLTPKGASIKRVLKRFIEDEEIKRGYEYTDTPVLARTELYKISGHLAHYRKDMFIFDANDEEMALRPMTCPHQFMIYKSRKRSYRDLPIKYAECADLFRNEKSGELHGLTRVRQFMLADAHVICRPDQLDEEFKKVMDLVFYVMKCLGLEYKKDYWYRFSKRDPKDKSDKYIDNDKAWNMSEEILKKDLDALKLDYVEAEGEAAFYGPKLDIQMRNVYGKEDTAFTVQIDFALPERFKMRYTDKNGKEATPMIIHRSAIGCFERLMSFLIEKHAGKFPVWLSPIQAVIIPIADRHAEYCDKIFEELMNNQVRVEKDYSQERVEYKVRQAQVQKTPYMIVIGDKEIESGRIAVRDRDGKIEYNIELKDFINKVRRKNEDKSLDL